MENPLGSHVASSVSHKCESKSMSLIRQARLVGRLVLAKLNRQPEKERGKIYISLPPPIVIQPSFHFSILVSDAWCITYKQ